MAKRKKPNQKRRSKINSNLSSKIFSSLDVNEDEYESIEFHSYQITDEPVNIWSVPQEIDRDLEKIHHTLYEEPASTIEPIKELLKDYPYVPQLYNYLSVAYSQLGKHEEAEKIVAESYRRTPDYLFAKLNYAEICMKKGEYDLIPDIFDGKFEIKALYPDRDTFHITEVIGFWGVAGLYFAGIGKDDTARLFYNNLKELVPDHPYTRKLKHHFLVMSARKTFEKLLFPNRNR